MKHYYVYILASKKDGVLYIGVTNNLLARIDQHKNHTNPGFTNKYFVGKLVYFEETENVESAIHREKQLKKWNRDWKIALIEKENPDWEDLYSNL
jgi:putative endonuclease